MDKYWINSKGENLGPFTREEISEKVEAGEFVLSDPICLVGNEEWLDLGEFLNSDSIIDQKEVDWKDEQKVIVAPKIWTFIKCNFNHCLIFSFASLCGALFVCSI